MKRYQRQHKITKHHILPRSRNGSDDRTNIIYLPRFKHDAWHDLFGLRDFDEAISLIREWKRRVETSKIAV